MDRLLLTIGLVVIIGLAVYGLLVGWRHRLARQAGIAAPPPVPADLGEELTAPVAALYVSTTTAGDWQNRIAVHGLGQRAPAALRLHSAGVLIDRRGPGPLFVPAEDLLSVRTAPGIAGKVMGMAEGVLVITWTLGGTAVDTGVVVNDLDGQQEWIQAAQQLLPGTARSTDGVQ